MAWDVFIYINWIQTWSKDTICYKNDSAEKKSALKDIYRCKIRLLHNSFSISWFVTPWSACSSTCGLGRKKRNITCKERKPNGYWRNRPNKDCQLSQKPVSINTCVEKACYLSWRTSAWSKVDFLPFCIKLIHFHSALINFAQYNILPKFIMIMMTKLIRVCTVALSFYFAIAQKGQELFLLARLHVEKILLFSKCASASKKSRKLFALQRKMQSNGNDS